MGKRRCGTAIALLCFCLGTDPTSDARLVFATGHDIPIIVVCSEGYTSSLAAASLQELGLVLAADIIGGFHAWRAAGLPATLPTRLAQLDR